MNTVNQFEVGKTYQTRSVCDHNCIIKIEVISRTAKSIKVKEDGKEEKTLRIFMLRDESVEAVRPWGKYSMSPIVEATDTRILLKDWEKPMLQVVA